MADGARRRRRLPVGVRGLRAGAVRVRAERRAVRVRRPVPRSAEVAPARHSQRSFPGTQRRAPPAVHAPAQRPEQRARATWMRCAGRARTLTWANAARRLVEIYREAARCAGARRGHAQPRRGRPRSAAEQSTQVVVKRTVARARTRAAHVRRARTPRSAPACSLIGPNGALPEDLQRALLALSARPALSRPLFGALARVFAAGTRASIAHGAGCAARR